MCALPSAEPGYACPAQMGQHLPEREPVWARSLGARYRVEVELEHNLYVLGLLQSREPEKKPPLPPYQSSWCIHSQQAFLKQGAGNPTLTPVLRNFPRLRPRPV